MADNVQLVKQGFDAFNLRAVQVWTLEGDKAIGLDLYPTVEEALAAVKGEDAV